MLSLAPSSASAQGENGNVLIYSGTTGYRHEGGSQAIPPNGETTGAVAADPGSAHRRGLQQRLSDL